MYEYRIHYKTGLGTEACCVVCSEEDAQDFARQVPALWGGIILGAEKIDRDTKETQEYKL